MNCRVLKGSKCVITQGYKKGVHDGVDIVGVNSKGTHILDYIVAHSDGVVVSYRKDYKTQDKSGSSYGNYVKIKHEDGYYTLYAHMSYNTVKVKTGDKVKKGQTLGYMGATGRATAGHLHFEVRDTNDVRIDPIPYLDKDLPDTQKSDFISGCDYKTLSDMYVRWGAGFNYGIKLVKDLTVDGKKNATSKNPYSYAVYKKGTIYTALEVIKINYGVWAKTPSGYVCMEGASKTKYASKI